MGVPGAGLCSPQSPVLALGTSTPPLCAQGVLSRAAGCVLEKDMTIGATWLQHFCRVRPFSSAAGHKRVWQGARGWELEPPERSWSPPPKSFCPLSACKPHSRQSQGCVGHPGSVVWGCALGLGARSLPPCRSWGGSLAPQELQFGLEVGHGGPRHSSRREGQDQQDLGSASLPLCVTSVMFPRCSVTLQRAPPGCTPIWDHPDLSSLPTAASAPGGCRDGGGVPP